MNNKIAKVITIVFFVLAVLAVWIFIANYNENKETKRLTREYQQQLQMLTAEECIYEYAKAWSKENYLMLKLIYRNGDSLSFDNLPYSVPVEVVSIQRDEAKELEIKEDRFQEYYDIKAYDTIMKFRELTASGFENSELYEHSYQFLFAKKNESDAWRLYDWGMY